MKQLTNLIFVIGALFSAALIENAQTCLTAGCLDETFGIGGKVLSSINFSKNWANAVAVQPDGKIVVAAYNNNSPANTGKDFYVLRYNPDGSLDSYFGSDGIARISFTSAYDSEIPYALALQSDGKIVVGGSVPGGFGIARLNTDGLIDSTFGSNGKVSFNFSSKDAAGLGAIAIQTNGYIVAAGISGGNFAFARLTPGGALDTSFNGTGKLTFLAEKNTGGSASSLAIQPDGKIVSAGARSSLRSTGEDFAVLRLNTNGTLDSSFGSGGKVFTDFIGLADRAKSVAIDSAGKIVVGGIAKMGSSLGNTDLTNYRFAVVRYTPNGTLDTSFDGDGRVTAGITNYYNGLKGLVVQSDGKIAGAGVVYTGDRSVVDGAVVRFNSDGSPDNTFGSNGNGIVTTDLMLQDEFFGFAMQPDGKFVAVGVAGTGDYIGLARYLP
jgi:uncharacterized delta-60 repeat protein